jgi:hypothetical protein
MKEAQSVGLNHLSHSENSAKLVRCGRDLDGQQCVAGFRRSDQMAHWADATDARHQRWHLREWPPLTKLLESPELGYMESRVFHPAMLVEVQGDFRVALDARDGINDDCLSLCHKVS